MTAVFIALLLAQAAPDATAQDARIEGIVRSTEGDPLGGALVRLYGFAEPGLQQPFEETATADDGTFVFENVLPGRNYRLSAKRAGFADTTYGTHRASSSGKPLTVVRGQTLKDIVIEMAGQGAVSGTVTDVNGDPVPSVIVSVLRPIYENGVRRLQAFEATTSNDVGEYRLAGLAPGTFYVQAAPQILPSGNAGDAPRETNLPTFYPSTTEESAASPIVITPGAEIRNANIQLRRGRVFEISGAVLDAEGKPLSGLLLLAGIERRTLVLASTVARRTRPDGTFAIVAPSAGRYVLQNVPIAIDGRTHVVRELVTVVDKNVSGLVVRANTGTTIKGSLTMESGGLAALLAVPASRPTITLAVQDALGGSRSARADDDGAFEITALQPGEARAYIGRLPESVYVKSIRFGETDVTHSKIDVPMGASPELEIVLSPKAAAIVGVAPGAASTVTLWTAEPDPGLRDDGFRSVSADQNGTFEFRGLPPGVYYLAAWEDADPGLLPNRDFLGKFTSAAMKIELAEGAQQAVEAPVISAEAYAAEEEKLP